MRSLYFLFGLVLSAAALAQALPTERQVDVARYMGKWYAHSYLPQFFLRGCRGQIAEYEVINEKKISILNTCLKRRGHSLIRGEAVVTNAGDNSEFIVTFDSFFTRLFRVKGDYNIIRLDENYEYVLVGGQDRKSLWLMSRSELPIPEAIRTEYLQYAKSLGFNTKKLLESRF
jgi:apolipoprotein D and lipocalin family protein